MSKNLKTKTTYDKVFKLSYREDGCLTNNHDSTGIISKYNMNNKVHTKVKFGFFNTRIILRAAARKKLGKFCNVIRSRFEIKKYLGKERTHRIETDVGLNYKKQQYGLTEGDRIQKISVYTIVVKNKASITQYDRESCSIWSYYENGKLSKVVSERDNFTTTIRFDDRGNLVKWDDDVDDER